MAGDERPCLGHRHLVLGEHLKQHRDGQLPAGAAETVTEAGGAALLAGSGTGKAADELDAASRIWLFESPSAGPAALAGALAPTLAAVDMILLPARRTAVTWRRG
jgi:hypothetical protein